jgi:hypothetical protein
MLSTLALVSALLAQQPVCAPGQVAAPKSGGKCCFPGQSWNAKESRCAGKPQCPAGTVASRETCIEALRANELEPYPGKSTPAPQPAPQTAPPPPPAYSQPDVAPPPQQPPPPQYVPQQPPPSGRYEDGVFVPPGHHLEKRPRGSMYGTGIGLFGGGFLLSIFSSLFALVDVGFSRNECAQFVAYTQWIPLAGPLIATFGQRGVTYSRGGAATSCTLRSPLYEFGVGIAVIETLLQAAGATLFILGFTLQEKVAVPDDTPRVAQAVGLELGLGAPGSAAGLSATLRW